MEIKCWQLYSSDWLIVEAEKAINIYEKMHASLQQWFPMLKWDHWVILSDAEFCVGAILSLYDVAWTFNMKHQEANTQ